MYIQKHVHDRPCIGRSAWRSTPYTRALYVADSNGYVFQLDLDQSPCSSKRYTEPYPTGIPHRAAWQSRRQGGNLYMVD